MIDIHTHILPLVDDGSDSVEATLSMLKVAVEQGITDVVCTPHFRHAHTCTPEEIRDVFAKTKELVEKENLPIKLYLGQEIYLRNDDTRGVRERLANGSVLTMNDTKYVLVEFDFNKECDIADAVYELVAVGYQPIVAHVERYRYLVLDDVMDIKASGGLIQINADSIVGKSKRVFAKRIKELFKNDLVDFVASDVHSDRENCFLESKAFIIKKFGAEVAEAVFKTNAEKILKG